MKTIPVIDLFAGPGGLGEGFAALKTTQNSNIFNVCLSVEKDKYAYKTLVLRNFFRQFNPQHIPSMYYEYLKGRCSVQALYDTYRKQSEAAEDATWLAVLGEVSSKIVDNRIRKKINGSNLWVLVGGPPCQAYSIVGRARLGGLNPSDPRAYLYREYLRIIAEHNPPIFVMENVKGLLSSKIGGDLIFKEMLKDLSNPSVGVFKINGNGGLNLKEIKYKIFAFSNKPKSFGEDNYPIYDPKDFIVECESYGVPQIRHRVFLLGIREDLNTKSLRLLRKRKKNIAVEDIIGSLPRIRSGLWRENDSKNQWKNRIHDVINQNWMVELGQKVDKRLYNKIYDTVINIKSPHKDKGGSFVDGKKKINLMQYWFYDKKLKGACNHEAKSHMIDDIYRYMFVSCYGKVYNKSPLLQDFPEDLLPEHKNAKIEKSKRTIFLDRFRVQLSNKPSTTITSHIAKDGHYFIHPDPSQCRSFTVREAARLQTFPDNYFFCGPKTSQYIQVGNAVPPSSRRLSGTQVYKILKSQR